MKAVKNLPGSNVVQVEKLNTKLLTLGHNTPRKCLWTKGAIEKLSKNKLFTGAKNE